MGLSALSRLSWRQVEKGAIPVALQELIEALHGPCLGVWLRTP